MFPKIKTGKFTVPSSSNSSGINVDIGFIPGKVKLRLASSSVSVSAQSSVVLAVEADLGMESSSVVKELVVTRRERDSASNYEDITDMTSSSSSNAITVLNENSISSSSSDLTVTGLLGFKVAAGLAGGDWKGKTVYYEALWPDAYEAVTGATI